jgi:hypothetical protein
MRPCTSTGVRFLKSLCLTLTQRSRAGYHADRLHHAWHKVALRASLHLTSLDSTPPHTTTRALLFRFASPSLLRVLPLPAVAASLRFAGWPTGSPPLATLPHPLTYGFSSKWTQSEVQLKHHHHLRRGNRGAQGMPSLCQRLAEAARRLPLHQFPCPVSAFVPDSIGRLGQDHGKTRRGRTEDLI